MSDSILPAEEPQIQPRSPYPYARPGPIPDARLESLFVEKPPSLVVRAASSSAFSFDTASATATCGPNDNSGACEKYYNSDGNSNTLPIVLGVVIPLGIAFIVLIVLHRRHVKKLRKEDAEDKHKSLDFGLGEGGKKIQGKSKGQRSPEMTLADEKELGGGRRPRGLSMDLSVTNPYLLPPGLQGSRESLHSLSRTIHGEDRYRPTDFIPDDGSIRPPSSLRSPADDSSSWTGSSSRRFNYDSKQNLVSNAQPNPIGSPSLGNSASFSRDSSSNAPHVPRKPLTNATSSNLLAPGNADTGRDSFVSTTSSVGPTNALRASNNYLAQYISGGQKQDSTKSAPNVTVKEVEPPSPVEQIQAPPPPVLKDDQHSRQNSNAPSVLQETNLTTPGIMLNAPDERQPRLPQLSLIESKENHQTFMESTDSTSPPSLVTDHTPQHSASPSTDLTQHDHVSQSHQTSNEEKQLSYYDQEDFYDESEEYGDQYADHDDLGYDPRRLTMGMRPLPPDDPSENPEQRANRIRSFYKEYFDDSKPHQPPQGYYDGSEGYYENYDQGAYDDQAQYYDQSQYYPPRGHSQMSGYGRHRATVSNGSPYMDGPRAFSSASARYHQPYPMAPKKRLPPPRPLNVLPTPHLLKEDTMLPMDFAPPKKFSNQRSGTPDSLRGGARPYSPSVRAHVPLASSFDDLAMIPSPHQLRKSSTFTALDFAPPGRLRTNDTMSETGSIRSNRSGISAMHVHNIRNGAYRISRIPKNVAGTRNEMAEALKPQWNLNR